MSDSADARLDRRAAQRSLPDPFTLVIFGASGDLTRSKLIPAVHSLFCQGLLPERFAVIGFARREKTDETFRREMRQAVEGSSCTPGLNEDRWTAFAGKLHYHCADYEQLAGFQSLRERLTEIASANGMPGNCLFYLATPPNVVLPIIRHLRRAGLACPRASRAPWCRVVLEKPVGRDLQTARALNEHVAETFSERQVFRIDHYLGKETVQNILVLRFANAIFEPIWNQKYVDHVQITVSETIGMAGRGRYYEQAGALRDIVQNHMMHLLSLIAMEPPGTLESDAIRDEKVKLLRALRPIPPDCTARDVVRAQYVAGTCAGKAVCGYRQEEGVAPDSMAETYVALRVLIDNWRWAGVPFYLRTGKRLAARVTEISIHLKAVPQVLFNALAASPMEPNVLAVRVQPDEGISLQFQVKVPGPAMRIQPLKMDFGYAAAFGQAPPEAYERLLLDAALGEATLFTRSDEVEAAWDFVTPILEGCARPQAGRLAVYPAGTWGPQEADALIRAHGHEWHVR